MVHLNINHYMPTTKRISGENTIFEKLTSIGLVLRDRQSYWRKIGTKTLFWCCCIYETMGNKGTLIFNFVLFSDVTIPHESVTITL